MVTMDTIVNLCKRRGFVFQSSEIYGGLESCWDYGPLGVELKRNVKNAWWKAMVGRRHDVVGIDASILMNPRVWEASGHIAHFSDPMVDCKQCQQRFRADHMPEFRKDSKWIDKFAESLPAATSAEGYLKALDQVAKKLPDTFVARVKALVAGAPPDLAGALTGMLAKACPRCGGELTEPRQFNLMFKTYMGAVEEAATTVYMRPETAQGIFVNFSNVQTAMRKKIPFGVAQVGKSFRNEITPGNFTFRTREFEQMEMEFFCKPGSDEEWHQKWIDERMAWYRSLGMRPENLRLREHGKDELAFYAKRCVDIDYLFPMGWSELEGIANRTDYDLKQHSQFSGKNLTYFDDETKEHYTPYVIEPAAGADRATLAFLIDAYHEEPVKEEKRVVLRFHPELAPIKVAVLPLLRNRPEIVALAREICDRLKQKTMAVYDDTGAIGKLYRRQDEIGTPYCLTVDVDSLEDRKVTIRDRDTMAQDRIPVAEVDRVVLERLAR